MLPQYPTQSRKMISIKDTSYPLEQLLSLTYGIYLSFFNTSTQMMDETSYRAALHDETIYKDPDVFDPERFLSPRNEPDSSKFAFGFGRR